MFPLILGQIEKTCKCNQNLKWALMRTELAEQSNNKSSRPWVFRDCLAVTDVAIYHTAVLDGAIPELDSITMKNKNYFVCLYTTEKVHHGSL